MMHREKLEENPGGKSKAELDAEVAQHRAKLIAEAESKKAESSAKASSKSGHTGYAHNIFAFKIWFS